MDELDGSKGSVTKLLRSRSFPLVRLEGVLEPASWWHRRIQEQAMDSCSGLMATSREGRD